MHEPVKMKVVSDKWKFMEAKCTLTVLSTFVYFNVDEMFFFGSQLFSSYHFHQKEKDIGFQLRSIFLSLDE